METPQGAEHRRAPPIDTDVLESGLSFALERIEQNVAALGPNEYLEAASSKDYIYDVDEGPNDWTPSFWTGLCWLGDLLEGDKHYRETATGHLEPFRQRFSGVDGGVLTHDLGFLYTLAAWANYDRTGSEASRQTALRAAHLLTNRFHPEPGVIQA
jgi:unsaturated chondroitin disaccharide hydrolase